MNNSPKNIKISKLGPNIKGQYLLIFQIAQILDKNSNDEYLICRIVDETGIITAYFNQYVKFITKGSVYELMNLRCRVVDHHLRLQMTKESQLCKKPLKIGFKDWQNDLSAKFYVQIVKKNEEQKIDNEKQKDQLVINDQNGKKKILQEQTIQEKEKVLEQKIVKKKGNKEDQQSRQIPQNNQRKFKKQSNVQVKQQKKKYNPKIQERKIQQSKKNPQISGQQGRQRQGKKKYLEKNQTRKASQQIKKDHYFNGQQERQRYQKKKYVEKNQGQRNQGRKKQNENQIKNQTKNEIKNVRFNQIHLFLQKKVNLFGKVLKDQIKKEKYFLRKVADSTGAIYLEFQSNIHLQENQWYHFNGFKIHGDKWYQYVGSQQQNSSIQISEGLNDKAEYKFIYKKA